MGFLADSKIEGSNFKNEKSHVKKFYSCSVQHFVNFSTDSNSPAIKFFKTGSKYADIYLYKNSKISFPHEKKLDQNFF